MINLVTYEVLNSPSIEEGVRYLKTQYQSNKLRFKERFLKPLLAWLKMNGNKSAEYIVSMYEDLFDQYDAYSYEEAFKIENQQFRAMVFSVIDVPQMIASLGSTRIKTEGINLKNKVFFSETGESKEIDMHQVYELHEVNGEKLGIREKIYAIKCWCTSTNKEHWLWTLNDTNPLEAIASCCIVYKPMLGKIKSIIRQGDVFLFEMLEEVEITEDMETVPLTADVYFKLLRTQS